MKTDYVNKMFLDTDIVGGVSVMEIEQFKSDGVVYINFLTPNFYSMQGSWFERFWKAVKLAFFILIGKEYALHTIGIEDNNKLQEFKKFVSQMGDVDDESS